MRDIKIYSSLFAGGLHNGQIKWEEYVQPGRNAVDVEWLYTAADTGPTGAEAYIAHFKPGSHGDLHEHLGYELLLILEGELHNDNGDRYPAGTLFIEKPESIHQVSSPTGCYALVVREKGTRRLTDDEVSAMTAAGAAAD
ncbi:cupin domain-containing protein [Lentzea sp. NPDC004782]|jgi:anti-sigma factor ChrR (cupin superfamily)|uniref:cupin domain-containing protein n=1 Tax=Lentzea sp. NPDC004782 TaxID=3154458 RepID=UPI00339E7EE8